MADRLPDVLQSGLHVVFCGTAAGRVSAQRGAYYAGPGNKFWRTLHEVGMTPRQLQPDEFRMLLDFDSGLTDLCKAGAGSDSEISKHGFDVARLVGAVTDFRPAILAFNGKEGGETALGRKILEYGRQPETWDDTELFVLPSTSGAANGYWSIKPWVELGTLLTES